jgi:hypothetical protein
MERIMRHIALFALAALVSAPTFAGNLAEVAIIDRDTGRKLTTHYHRGEYWVAGRPGAHYAIQIRSREGQRVMAVTSVDGVNVVTGETAAIDQVGYVFNPREVYDITGWRKSDAEVAAFTFTSIPKSYAARTGRPENVGVIGVALFRERAKPRAQYDAPRILMEAAPPAGGSSYAPPPAPPVYGPPAPPAPPAPAAPRAESKAERSADAARAAEPSLGTGHGRRESSVVYQTQFERESPQPNEVIRIRYDSHANLVAMGVIQSPPPRPRQIDPFPNSPRYGYVPDP